MHNLWSLRNSSILRQNITPIIFVTCWSIDISLVRHMLVKRGHQAIASIMITKTQHTLLSFVLGLLLV